MKKLVNQTFYVIRLGGRLYVQTGFYKWYPSTTEDVLHAKRYIDAFSAEQAASKLMNAEVVKINITEDGVSNETSEDDVEMLERTIDELQRQNKRLRQQLEIFKQGQTDEEE